MWTSVELRFVSTDGDEALDVAVVADIAYEVAEIVDAGDFRPRFLGPTS